MIRAQLLVTSLPDVLFSGSDPTRNIVEESVIWFYCEVNSASSTLSVTWNKGGGTLVQDVPHIILRTSTTSSSTTLILVLDNVVSSDAGLYQCTAQDGQDISRGTILTITGYYRVSCYLYLYCQCSDVNYCPCSSTKYDWSIENSLWYYIFC